jgi:pimeloyl-ACP methyl ester carboxylesterase
MKVSQGFARVRDGTPIGYSVHGDASASSVAVLVHSLAMDRHFWDPVAAASRRGRRGARVRLPRPRRLGRGRQILFGGAVRR